MVHLVALLEAAQNRNGVFHRWLVHQHLLETPLQRRILLDVLAVFIQGCGADATQLAPGEHRFQQVAGIHGPPLALAPTTVWISSMKSTICPSEPRGPP